MDELEKTTGVNVIKRDHFERCPFCKTPFCTGIIEKAAIEVKCRRCKREFQIVAT